ncbi:hypothetical protein K2173_006764 [Erythroxylum novogranatense]|uniref:Uncharacterized protein n=1 Tax=Erythroxylum novogranatense TaxID=1862640 RepID=A0AAV8SYN7_9ROSI|nr:hypothetical protein K2173_006764 [Erythroxylum novogranatense]
MMEQSCRRLPSWMQLSTPVAAVVSDDATANKKRKKKTTIDSSAQKPEELSTSSLSLRKCGSKSDRISRESNREKKRKSVRKEVGEKRRRRVKNDSHESPLMRNNDDEDDNDDDSEDELTVEDLVSIAEEYVKAHENSKQQQHFLVNKEQELQIGHPPSSFSEKSVYVPDGKHKSPAVELHDSVDNLRNEQSSLTSSSKPGDPAQDMLDLLLGPLLKKPPMERKEELIVENIAFTDSVKMESQNYSREEIARPMKKKSSLKDKYIQEASSAFVPYELLVI